MTTNYQALRKTIEKAKHHNYKKVVMRITLAEQMLDERDAADKRIAELEAKDARIANLIAERDALREGEMGDARHSNTRAAADIYFQLVEECEIPGGGSLVEYVSDLREKAAGITTKGE